MTSHSCEADELGASLVEECEAFLDGRYAELLVARGEPVPYWGWLNLLAHGTEDELRSTAAELNRLHGWWQGRSLIAGEVLDAVDHRGRSLEVLQDEVLIPTEVAAMACPAASRGWSPAHLMVAISRYLRGAADQTASRRS